MQQIFSSRIPPKCLVRDACDFDLESARSPSIILSCPSLPVQAMLPALPSKLFTPLDFFPPQKLRRPERGRPSVSGGNFDPTFKLVCTVGLVPSLPGRCPFLLCPNIELLECRTCTLCKEFGHLFSASLKLKLLHMVPGKKGFPKKRHFLNYHFEKPGTTVHDHWQWKAMNCCCCTQSLKTAIQKVRFFGTTCTYFYMITSVKAQAG